MGIRFETYDEMQAALGYKVYISVYNGDIGVSNIDDSILTRPTIRFKKIGVNGGISSTAGAQVDVYDPKLQLAIPVVRGVNIEATYSGNTDGEKLKLIECLDVVAQTARGARDRGITLENLTGGVHSTIWQSSHLRKRLESAGMRVPLSPSSGYGSSFSKPSQSEALAAIRKAHLKQRPSWQEAVALFQAGKAGSIACDRSLIFSLGASEQYKNQEKNCVTLLPKTVNVLFRGAVVGVIKFGEDWTFSVDPKQEKYVNALCKEGVLPFSVEDKAG